MAYQKKQYRSIDPKTNRAQKRGGGMTTRLNNVHRYATRPVETPASPTWLKSRQPRAVKV